MGVQAPSQHNLLRIESELLKQALKIGLGFSESQLSSAIKHFLQVFETVEEARVWIPSDNFSIIVDYILENGDPRQQSLAGITGKMKSHEGTSDGETRRMHLAERSAYISEVENCKEQEVKNSKHKMWLSEVVSKKSCTLDRNIIHSHHRRKMSPEVSARFYSNGIRTEGDNCLLDQNSTTIEGELSSLPSEDKLKATSLVQSVLKLEGVDDINKRNSDGASPSQMKGSNGHLKYGKLIPPHSGNNPEVSQVNSKETIQSKCIEVDKKSLDGNTGQSEKTKSISAICLESSELAIIARKDTTTTEVASSSKSNGSRAVLDLEVCLREGKCEEALNIFMAWKNAGFEVECQKIRTNKTINNGGEHELLPDIPGKKRGVVVCYDISRGLEKVPISCVNEYNTDILPEGFLYITKSVIRQSAHVDTSLSRIGDLHCSCAGDCLRSPESCKCTDSTRGEYAYDETGRLIERLATDYPSGWGTQKGDFITECCNKCCCSIDCGNRVVQRGITKRLQIFMTPNRKGWGIRALEKIPAYSFVFEYLGEIATNSEQFDRNMEYEKNGVYTYTMNLDADLDMEKKHFGEGLTDSELLVLDATRFGNVSRFLNHRCHDANLFMRPVQIETRDTHYYHAAFFAVRDIEEMEELTWDYGIDFSDDTHQVKAFTCQCKSQFCRDSSRKRKSVKVSGGKKNRRVSVSTERY